MSRAPSFADVQSQQQDDLNSPRNEGDPLLATIGFLDAFPGPLEIKGKRVYPLTNDDYSTWLETETATLRDRRRKSIPQQANAVERFKINDHIDNTEVTPDDLMGQIHRPVWTNRIIQKALENAELSQEEIVDFTKRLPAKGAEMLAHRLSGLYTMPHIERIYSQAFSTPAPAPQTFGGRSPLAGSGGARTNSPDTAASEENKSGSSNGSTSSGQPEDGQAP